MRTDRDFISSYRSALVATAPSAIDIDIEQVRLLGTTELCLHFVEKHLPHEDISCVPYLMLGYPRIIGSLQPSSVQALAIVRHLCTRYVSVSAWLDACQQHARFPETFKVFEIHDRKPLMRKSASPALCSFLAERLKHPVPWVQRGLKIAPPGESLVPVNRGETFLAYQIPQIANGTAMAMSKYQLTPRTHNPPIQITFRDMMSVARAVDTRESRQDWPKSLPPLRLEERLSRLRIDGLETQLFQGDTLTLDKAVHLVGMLSSGKSTLVWAILFALTRGSAKKRIAVLVTDTIQAATIAARLRLHNVGATVLSSLYNRDRHLSSIHWQQGLLSNGWALTSIGDIAQGFSIACPLDGMQPELRVARGAHDDVSFPSFDEKPCHRLHMTQCAELKAADISAETDIDDGESYSCPLWAKCPAQEQQRSAVEADVLLMTPQAFVHMTPDKFVSENNITIPEMVQFARDLVIIDEVDGMQKAMDEIFAPRSQIMGDELSVYAPAISLRSSEALRERSGIQFRREVNTKWQANFHAFFRLIGVIYALLQNEDAFLYTFFENKPFTAASILYELWQRRKNRPQGKNAPSLTDRELESEFLQVIKLASAISQFSQISSISEEDRDTGQDEPLQFPNRDFQLASEALQDLAREILVADYYKDVIPVVEAMLGDKLKIFRPAHGSGEVQMSKTDMQGHALALVLAVVTELALSHYNWLIKTQPAVARAFGIDDAQLFSQANNLIRHYRTLLPWNPAGAIFGFFYDGPAKGKEHVMGGKLTLVNHLGVGRYLVTHLHDLLAAEGQAGPHVLMLSGTSWAGGSSRRSSAKTRKPIDAASPSFDVQVPVRGVLRQPDAELAAIKKSLFSLVHIPDENGNQVKVSGLPEKDRRSALANIARRLVMRRDETNLIEENWSRMAARWGEQDIEDRRRVLLVVNSYADAAIVAAMLLETLEGHGYNDWNVRCLTPDQADDSSQNGSISRRFFRELPRSLVETFGDMGEKSLLVAPMTVIARGHNILNRSNKAAISAIYFLHRPHPRPDDLAPIIGRLNRFALERFENGLSLDPTKAKLPLSVRARRMRHAATKIVRLSLDLRGGYSSLPSEYKAQFAWDMLTPLWQTVGRGIRNGCPVFVGFVDCKFAPESFDGREDTPDSSALVQAIEQLKAAMDPGRNPRECKVARLLYEPFYEALTRTKGLKYA